jgi:hypothetical protein
MPRRSGLPFADLLQQLVADPPRPPPCPHTSTRERPAVSFRSCPVETRRAGHIKGSPSLQARCKARVLRSCTIRRASPPRSGDSSGNLRSEASPGARSGSPIDTLHPEQASRGTLSLSLERPCHYTTVPVSGSITGGKGSEERLQSKCQLTCFHRQVQLLQHGKRLAVNGMFQSFKTARAYPSIVVMLGVPRALAPGNFPRSAHA